MKFTKNWLLDYLEPNCSFNEILNGLLKLGLEVEKTIDYTLMLKDFSVAEILETKKHDNAQKLQICTVNTIHGVKQIVCGAPNARKGIKVIFANVGTYIPGLDITLKDIAIRGVKSSGMLVSEMELGISSKHSYIIEIPEEIPVGILAPVALGLDDILIEVAVTPNLGHLLSIKNIAKSLSALGLGTFKEKIYPQLIHENQHITAQQTNKFMSANINTDICSGAVIINLTNLNNTIQTPLKIANRLQLIGQELINPITDIINYLIIDINHPIFAYDCSKLTSKNISIDFGNKEDIIKVTNNKKYTNLSDIALVKVDNIPISIAGTVESQDVKITHSSKDIILECAYFSPNVIAKSSKKLSINTNANYHFKRGVNPLDLVDTANILINLITEVCGGKINDSIIVNNTQEYKTVVTTFTYINDILGLNIEKNTVINYLNKQDFIVSYNEDNLTIKVPSFRNDIEQDCDIAGLILNSYGIDNIPAIPINTNLTPLNNTNKINCQTVEYEYKKEVLNYDNSSFKSVLLVKKILSSLGLLETINMSFISKELAKLFDIYSPLLELSNPISNELIIMRKTLLPSLTKIVSNNLRQGYGNLKFFEVSNVFYDLNTIKTNVAIILSGYKHKKDWRNPNKLYDVFDSKSILFNLIQNLGMDPNRFKISKENIPTYLHIGKSGALLLGNTPLAYFGTLHPKIANYFNLKHNPMVFELFLNTLPPIKHNSTVKIKELSKQMPLERDFAFIVNKHTLASDIINIVYNTNKKLITEVKIFDIFNYNDNKKSIGLSVTINPKHTLTELEINNLSQSIITAVENKTGGTLRDK